MQQTVFVVYLQLRPYDCCSVSAAHMPGSVLGVIKSYLHSSLKKRKELSPFSRFFVMYIVSYLHEVRPCDYLFRISTWVICSFGSVLIKNVVALSRICFLFILCRYCSKHLHLSKK